MLRCKKLPLIPLLLLLPLAAAQQPPEPAAPAFDAGVVAGEVQEFYASYRQAWDDRDPEAVSAHLAADFVTFSHQDPHGVVKVDRKAAVAGVERFFEAVRRRDVLWRRSVLSIEPRSATEAMAVVRNDFSLAPAGEVELALEVLRKGKDGRWQLVRRWSEKHNF
jgi:hypothetical protein